MASFYTVILSLDKETTFEFKFIPEKLTWNNLATMIQASTNLEEPLVLYYKYDTMVESLENQQQLEYLMQQVDMTQGALFRFYSDRELVNSRVFANCASSFARLGQFADQHRDIIQSSRRLNRAIGVLASLISMDQANDFENEFQFLEMLVERKQKKRARKEATSADEGVTEETSDEDIRPDFSTLDPRFLEGVFFGKRGGKFGFPPHMFGHPGFGPEGYGPSGPEGPSFPHEFGAGGFGPNEFGPGDFGHGHKGFGGRGGFGGPGGRGGHRGFGRGGHGHSGFGHHRGFGPGGFGPRGFGPGGFGPGGFSPKGFGPEGFGPEGFGPRGFGPGGFGPHGPHGPHDSKDNEDSDTGCDRPPMPFEFEDLFKGHKKFGGPGMHGGFRGRPHSKESDDEIMLGRFLTDGNRRHHRHGKCKKGGEGEVKDKKQKRREKLMERLATISLSDSSDDDDLRLRGAHGRCGGRRRRGHPFFFAA